MNLGNLFVNKGVTNKHLLVPSDPPFASYRLDSIDFLRGVVIVLMALDHVRDYFTDAHFSATDLAHTNAALFFTRWATHFCAPVFFLLAGLGAYLSAVRGKTRSALFLFLITRGLWLIVLEITVVSFGWAFNFKFSVLFLQVIWALGASMVVMGGLVFLPISLIAAFGIMLIAGHNLLDSIHARDFGSLGFAWAILHSAERLPITAALFLVPTYPLVPWVGVMALGYGLGPLLCSELNANKRVMLSLGVLL